jgi:hypothetical protein
MDQEQRYFDTLAQVARYAVADDGALLLTTAEGKEIRLRREEGEGASLAAQHRRSQWNGA